MRGWGSFRAGRVEGLGQAFILYVLLKLRKVPSAWTNVVQCGCATADTRAAMMQQSNERLRLNESSSVPSREMRPRTYSLP